MRLYILLAGMAGGSGKECPHTPQHPLCHQKPTDVLPLRLIPPHLHRAFGPGLVPLVARRAFCNRTVDGSWFPSEWTFHRCIQRPKLHSNRLVCWHRESPDSTPLKVQPCICLHHKMVMSEKRYPLLLRRASSCTAVILSSDLICSSTIALTACVIREGLPLPGRLSNVRVSSYIRLNSLPSRH